jgi:hypothetical protein
MAIQMMEGKMRMDDYFADLRLCGAINILRRLEVINGNQQNIIKS